MRGDTHLELPLTHVKKSVHHVNYTYISRFRCGVYLVYFVLYFVFRISSEKSNLSVQIVAVPRNGFLIQANGLHNIILYNDLRRNEIM